MVALSVAALRLAGAFGGRRGRVEQVPDAWFLVWWKIVL
jgi:hypothetical protein